MGREVEEIGDVFDDVFCHEDSLGISKASKGGIGRQVSVAKLEVNANVRNFIGTTGLQHGSDHHLVVGGVSRGVLCGV